MQVYLPTDKLSVGARKDHALVQTKQTELDLLSGGPVQGAWCMGPSKRLCLFITAQPRLSPIEVLMLHIARW